MKSVVPYYNAISEQFAREDKKDDEALGIQKNVEKDKSEDAAMEPELFTQMNIFLLNAIRKNSSHGRSAGCDWSELNKLHDGKKEEESHVRKHEKTHPGHQIVRCIYLHQLHCPSELIECRLHCHKKQSFRARM